MHDPDDFDASARDAMENQELRLDHQSKTMSAMAKCSPEQWLIGQQRNSVCQPSHDLFGRSIVVCRDEVMDVIEIGPSGQGEDNLRSH